MRGKVLGAAFEHTYAPLPPSSRAWAWSLGPDSISSGVLLMDLDAFRKRGLKRGILDFVRRPDIQLLCPDQDALNGTLWDEVTEIHPRWNWSDGWLLRCARLPLSATRWRGLKPIEALEAALSPGILHFWGPHKPWHHNHRPEGPATTGHFVSRTWPVPAYRKRHGPGGLGPHYTDYTTDSSTDG